MKFLQNLIARLPPSKTKPEPPKEERSSLMRDVTDPPGTGYVLTGQQFKDRRD